MEPQKIIHIWNIFEDKMEKLFGIGPTYLNSKIPVMHAWRIVCGETNPFVDEP